MRRLGRSFYVGSYLFTVWNRKIALIALYAFRIFFALSLINASRNMLEAAFRLVHGRYVDDALPGEFIGIAWRLCAT